MKIHKPMSGMAGAWTKTIAFFRLVFILMVFVLEPGLGNATDELTTPDMRFDVALGNYSHINHVPLSYFVKDIRDIPTVSFVYYAKSHQCTSLEDIVAQVPRYQVLESTREGIGFFTVMPDACIPLPATGDECLLALHLPSFDLKCKRGEILPTILRRDSEHPLATWFREHHFDFTDTFIGNPNGLPPVLRKSVSGSDYKAYHSYTPEEETDLETPISIANSDDTLLVVLDKVTQALGPHISWHIMTDGDYIALSFVGMKE